VTPERFAQGMTFDQYVIYAGSPENLAREAGWWLGTTRRDFSGLLRDWHARARLSDAQADAVRWLAAQPGGPARMLVISEEWSSDCRRDVPMLARLAEAGGLEMRIFTRDGQTCSHASRADAATSPNADLVNEFLREQDGQTYQSVPVAAFFTKDFQHLYHYIEFPAIYHKERIFCAMQAKDPGDAGDKRGEAFMREWLLLQQGPFFPMWASAAVDEMLSALHERMVVGSPG
jgi:Thioredoxin